MPEIDDFDLTLSAETVQDFANAADRNLTAPSVDDNPTFHGGKEVGLGTWTEAVKIRETALSPVQKDPTNKNKSNFVLQLEVLGPSSGGFRTNEGRVHYQYFYIDKESLNSSDPKTSGSYKRRLAVINSLFAALGSDMSKGVASYKAMFEGDKPLIGMKVAAIMRKYRNRNTGETGVDIDGFMPIS